MLTATRERLLATLPDDAVVLDVGGWADPFERADWVVDLMPFESRGLYEREGWVPAGSRGPERFTAQRWIERDLCDPEPLPFADDEIDFAVCSHTLEDVRDPLSVCRELSRIAKAGYVEVPSRLEEQSWGVNGEFVGWSHHRWLIDIVDGGLELVAKPHSIHSRPDQYFTAAFWRGLSEDERVRSLWWKGSIHARERVIIGLEESDAYLGGFVARELQARGQNPRRSARARLGRLATRLRAAR
jgi:hypothetical protein